MLAHNKSIAISKHDHIWEFLKYFNNDNKVLFYVEVTKLTYFDERIGRPNEHAQELKTWLETVFFKQLEAYLGYNLIEN